MDVRISKMPPGINSVWAKPTGSGYALYFYYKGHWRPLVMTNTNGTTYPYDDIPVEGSNMVTSAQVRQIVVLTQTEYDALETKDPNTEYNIIEDDQAL